MESKGKENQVLIPQPQPKIVSKMDHEANVTPRFEQSQGGTRAVQSHGESKSCG